MPANYDSIIDDLANNDPEFLKLSPDQQDKIVMDLAQEKLGAVPSTENFLQKAIQQNRQAGMPFGSFTPKDGQEAMDLGRVGIRNLINPTGDFGMVGLGANMADKAMGGTSEFSAKLKKDKVDEALIPQTQYGKNLDFSAKVAPLAMFGLEGATGAAKGIKNFFSAGELPQEIEATKAGIQDIIHTGPKKVKARVGQIFDESQANFGERISNIPGGFNAQMTSAHFAEALEGAANEMGATNIPGSQGNRLMQMAGEMRNNPRTFYPDEIQAQTKQILNSFGGDTLSKAKFYNHFTGVLSREVPELASIKSEYAPTYDVARQAKVINKGNLSRVASDRIGPEQLGEMAQAQQMLGDEPNIVEQASASGRKLKQQQNQLQKIISRQKAAKIIRAGALGAGGFKAGNTLLDLFGKQNVPNE